MLWSVVNTDLTITTEKLVELYVFEAMSDGYLDALGTWLGLPQSKKDEIQRNYHNPPRGEKPSLTSMPLTTPALVGGRLLGNSVVLTFPIRLMWWRALMFKVL